MTNPTRTMPDFSTTLERRLVLLANADTEAAPPKVRSRRVRPLALLTGAAAIAGVAAAAVALSAGPGVQAAYGKPLILKAPTVDASQLDGGLASELALGADARFDQAREIPTAAGPAYLIGGTKGWCLSVPDPASSNPTKERGVTCAKPDVFDRIGLSNAIGGIFVAAIPQGVKNPTIRTLDGESRELQPSNLGVVTAIVTAKSVITLHGTDGGERSEAVAPGR